MNRLELREGDCLDSFVGLRSLEDRSIDHVITDPPYDEHTHSKNRTGSKLPNDIPGRETFGTLRSGRSRTRELGFAHIEPDQMADAARHFARIARRWILVFSSLELAPWWSTYIDAAGADAVRIGIWRKTGSTPQFSGDRPAVGAEAIVIAHQLGRKRWNGGGRHGVWECPIVLDRGHGEPRLHTTQKPVSLMEALVRDFTDPGETVCDPFMGSGTTGVACRRLGRGFVGWELDPKHYATARRRITETAEQLDLLGEPSPRMRQEELIP